MEVSTEGLVLRDVPELMIGEIPGRQPLKRKLTGKGTSYIFHLDENDKPVIVAKLYDQEKFLHWFSRATLKSFTHGRQWQKAKDDIQEEPKPRPSGRARRTGRTGDSLHTEG